MLKIFCVVYFLIYFSCVSSEKVTIKQGTLEGIENLSRNGRKFHSFLGIPYAKPPVEELRLKSPQPHPGWTGVYNATSEGSMCLQDMILFPKFKGIQLGQEDCLYVNVHTPQINPSKKLPVMVFIYGGAYQLGDSGSETYGPYYLLDRNVVYVNFNYRLGILGFLSFEDEVISGNFGLKDQNLALQWVKNNIETFGGDSNSITIFGESAGAASVHYHLLSPKSAGLFHRGILQSGSSFCPWALVPQGLAKKRAESATQKLGCTGNSKDILTCLQKVSPCDILRVQIQIEWSIDPFLLWVPVVEVPHPEAFITQHPFYYKGNPDIPLIVGINYDEGAIRTAELCSNDMLLIKELNEKWENLLPLTTMIRENAQPDDLPHISKAIKKFYLNDKNVDESNIRSLSDIYSDLLINYPTKKAAEHHSGKVYFYLYDYEHDVTFASEFGNCSINLGVSHADELINIFNLNSLFGENHQLKSKHLDISYKIIQIWTNFAEKGIPSDDLNEINWKTHNSNRNGEYLYIGNDKINIKTELFTKRFEFVESLSLNYAKLYKTLSNQKDEL